VQEAAVLQQPADEELRGLDLQALEEEGVQNVHRSLNSEHPAMLLGELRGPSPGCKGWTISRTQRIGDSRREREQEPIERLVGRPGESVVGERRDVHRELLDALIGQPAGHDGVAHLATEQAAEVEDIVAARRLRRGQRKAGELLLLLLAATDDDDDDDDDDSAASFATATNR
jgi:hypothetical protein